MTCAGLDRTLAPLDVNAEEAFIHLPQVGVNCPAAEIQKIYTYITGGSSRCRHGNFFFFPVLQSLRSAPPVRMYGSQLKCMRQVSPDVGI